LALYAGFACPREWKERLTSKEWEEIKALSRLEVIGPDRHDYGLAKVGFFIASASAKMPSDFDLTTLLPNKTKPPEQTIEDQYNALLAFSQQWQPKASEH
jgi:hypothetical protein